MNNKKSVMQKIVIAVSALVIIACSITTISLAWFTDTKIGTTILQFGKIEIDDENTFGGAATVFTEENLLASMKLNTADLAIDLTQNSNDALIRARFEFGVPETDAQGVTTRSLEHKTAAPTGTNNVYENLAEKIAAVTGTEAVEADVVELYNQYIDWLKEVVEHELPEDMEPKTAYVANEAGALVGTNYKFIRSTFADDINYYLVDEAGLPLAAKQNAMTMEFEDVVAGDENIGTLPAGVKYYRANAEGALELVADAVKEGDMLLVKEVEGYVFADEGQFKIANTANQLTGKIVHYEAATGTAVAGKEYFQLVEGKYEPVEKAEGADLANTYVVKDEIIVEYAQYMCELGCKLTAEAMQTSIVAEENIYVGAMLASASNEAVDGGSNPVVKGVKYTGADLTVDVLAVIDEIAFRAVELPENEVQG